MYQIKRGNTVVWSGKVQGKQSKVIMQEDRVEITVKTPVPINFKKGDTIQVYGESYKLNRPENINRISSQVGYTYTIEFEAIYYDLGKWMLNTLDKNNNLTEPDVYIMGEASAILGLLVQNANRTDSGWTLGTVEKTDTIQWAYNGAKLLTVLQDVADRTGLEFWCIGKQINLTRKQPSTGIVLQYGKGKGLYEIHRERKGNPVITHMNVQGGSQNIPNGYGFRQIQPAGGNPMINPNYVEGGEIVEDVLTFENVYPRLEASVTSINGLNAISSTDIDFDLNSHLLNDGTSAQIAFTSGLLNGFKFTIAAGGFNNATKTITFNNITDENAYPDGVPNQILKPAIGDSFVLLNISMPQSYVTAAEARVKELGDQYFAEEGIEQYTWSGKITPKFILENNISLTLGGLVTLNASDIGFSGPIRIASYVRDLEEEYLYEFTLSNIISINSLVRQRNQSDRLANAVSKGLSSDGLSVKATYAETAGFATLAGHANSATNAATSNFANEALHATNADYALRASTSALADKATLADRATNADHADWASLADRALLADYALDAAHAVEADHALLADRADIADYAYDSDKWDGKQFADYLDQPVKVNSDVRHRSISSPAFISGATGSGWKFFEDGSAEVDNLTVRKALNVVQLNIREITGTGGSFAVTNVAKIHSVTEFPDYFSCVINTDDDALFVPFVAGDIVRCQVWDGKGIKYYVGRVRGVSQAIFDIEKPLLAGGSVPEAGDNVFQFGSSVAGRQGLLYMTNSDSGAPYLDVLDDVNSPNLDGKTKVRLGKLDGIVDGSLGALSGYGLYAQNAFLKGKFIVQSGSNVYTKSDVDATLTNVISDVRNTTEADIANAIKNISIGGRNLIPKTKDFGFTKDYYNINFSVDTATPSPLGQLDSTLFLAFNGNLSNYFRIENVIKEPNTEYTFSCWIGRPGHTAAHYRIGYGDSIYKEVSVSEWQKFEITFTSYADISIYDFIQFTSILDIANGLWIYQPKLEKGNKATDWLPAPEDVEQQVIDTDTARKAYIDAQDNLKETQTKAYADGKISDAESRAIADATDKANAAKAYADAQDNLLRTQVNAYADGKISAEEQARINQAEAYLNAAKAYTEAQDNLIKIEANAYADGIVTAEEARAIADAQAKLAEAKSDATAKANQAKIDAIAVSAYDATNKANQAKADAIATANQFAMDAVSAIKLGGRNLVWNSDIDAISNSYLVKYFTLTEAIRFGETYTITIWGEMPEGRFFGMWDEGGSAQQCEVHKIFNGVFRGTWTASEWVGSRVIFSIYQLPNDVGTFPEAKIDKIKVERGNKGSDWTPAPTDIENALEIYKTSTNTKFEVLETSISSKVSQDSFNILGQKVADAESSIIQNATAIQSKVSQTEFDALNNSVTGISGRVTTAESTITQHANQIQSKVSQSEVDVIVSDAISGINIGGRNFVLESDYYNTLGEVIGHPTLSLSQQPIYGEEYTLSFWGKSAVGATESGWVAVQKLENWDASNLNIRITIPSGTTNWTRFQGTFTALGTAVDQIIWLYSDGNYKFEIKDIKLERGNQVTDWTPAPEDMRTDLSDIRTRVSNAETTITQNTDAINLRAVKTEVDSQINSAIGASKSYTDNQISITNEAINLKASTTYVNNAISNVTTINDTRDTNQPPSWYFANHPYRTVREFKLFYIVGLPDIGETYAQVTTNVPWGDPSGGHVVQEAKLLERIFTRHGTTDIWSAWEEKESVIGAQSKANTAYNNSVAHTNSQITILGDRINLSATKEELNNIKIGGRNYLKPSTVIDVFGGLNVTFKPYGFDFAGNQNGEGTIRMLDVINEVGYWTVSGLFRGTQNISVGFEIDICDGALSERFMSTTDNSWTRFSFTSYVPTVDSTYNFVDFSKFVWVFYEFKDIKIEKGNKATDWTPAPEDIEKMIIDTDTARKAYIDAQDNLKEIQTKAYADGKVSAEEARAIADATAKANAAYDSAVTFTSSQLTIANDRITAESLRINGLTGRVESAEFKLQPDQINLTVKSQVDDSTLRNSWSSGKPLNPDPTFKEGFNGLSYYNNLGTPPYRWQHLLKSAFSEIFPTSSPYGVYFASTPSVPTSPDWGGFHFNTQSRAKAKFLVRLVMAFEESAVVNFHSNPIGDYATTRWLTPTVGKGINNFAEYIHYVECGATGSFSTTNFFAFSGGTTGVSVRIAFAGVYDITDAINNYTTNEEIASSFTIAPNGITLAGKTINLTGMVTFGSLDADAQGRVNTAESTANSALHAANTANNNLSALQGSLKDLAFQDKLEFAKLGATVVDGGYLKTELLNVNEIFAKNVTASGTIVATNLTVTGQSMIGGFKISGGALIAGSNNQNDSTWLPNTSNLRIYSDYSLFRVIGSDTSFVKEVRIGLNYNPASTGRPYNDAMVSKSTLRNTAQDTFGSSVPANSRQKNRALILEALNSDENIAMEIMSGQIYLRDVPNADSPSARRQGYVMTKLVNGVYTLILHDSPPPLNTNIPGGDGLFYNDRQEATVDYDYRRESIGYCEYPSVASRHTAIVPAGTVSSAISRADANTKAYNQAYDRAYDDMVATGHCG